MSKDLRNTLIAAVVFLLVALGLGYYVYDMYTQLEAVKADNQGLQKEIDDLTANFSPKVIETLQNELKELNVNLKEYVKILPSADVATEEVLLRSVQEHMTGAGITLASYTRQKGVAKAEFEELKLLLNATGTFEQFVDFLNRIERHESFLRVNSFTATASRGAPAKSDKGAAAAGKDMIGLQLNVDISTYRYTTKSK